MAVVNLFLRNIHQVKSHSLYLRFSVSSLWIMAAGMLLFRSCGSAPSQSKEATPPPPRTGIALYLPEYWHSSNHAVFAPIMQPLLQKGMDTAFLVRLMTDSRVQFKESLVKINVTGYRKPTDYSQHHDAYSVNKGISFMEQHSRDLDSAAAKYNVPKQAITAILWIETKFGKITGNHSIASVFLSVALANRPENIEKNKNVVRQELSEKKDTTGLYELEKKIEQRANKKSAWAIDQLMALDSMRSRYHADVLDIKGSFAGAFGLSQFLPSSYRSWAVDGDGDGKINLFDEQDAIFSVANYLSVNGWRKDRESHEKAVFHYNNSKDYVSAVLTLAEKLGMDK
ncbi:MAG: lytic murein transglycosylase [Ignavibacteria bacterium]|nr:lytic murein transglycosylase [Ignavibacteria bacterium]